MVILGDEGSRYGFGGVSFGPALFSRNGQLSVHYQCNRDFSWLGLHLVQEEWVYGAGLTQTSCLLFGSPSSAQVLLLILLSGITSRRAQGTYGVLGINPWSAEWKASILPIVLSLQPAWVYLNVFFWIVFFWMKCILLKNLRVKLSCIFYLFLRWL